MLSTGLHLASESTTQGAEAFDTACRERCLIPGFCEARGLIFARPLAISNRLDTMLFKEQPGTPSTVTLRREDAVRIRIGARTSLNSASTSKIIKVYENDITT